MGTLYIAIILLCRVVQHLFGKPCSNMVSGLRMYIGYSAFKNAVSAVLGLCLVLFSGAAMQADFLTVAIAALSGISIAVGGYTEILALKSGTIALSSMFSTAGLLVPCIAGIFLFNVPMSLWQWVGLGIFFVSAWLLTADAKKTCHTFRPKTVMLLLVSLLSNGCTMLSQQLFTHFRPNASISIFSLMTFGIVAVAMLVLFLTTGRGKEQTPVRFPKKLLLFGSFLSVAVFIINQLATAATAFVEPVVLFSFINCGSTVIGVIIAHLVFGEKITPRKTLGIAAGILSLIIIKAL